jgi:hypothetical protein
MTSFVPWNVVCDGHLAADTLAYSKDGRLLIWEVEAHGVQDLLKLYTVFKHLLVGSY